VVDRERGLKAVNGHDALIHEHTGIMNENVEFREPASEICGTFAVLAGSLPWMITEAPMRASVRAVCLPMPSVPPVTRTVRPFIYGNSV
jgi:hypothetical protein